MDRAETKAVCLKTFDGRTDLPVEHLGGVDMDVLREALVLEREAILRGVPRDARRSLNQLATDAILVAVARGFAAGVQFHAEVSGDG